VRSDLDELLSNARASVAPELRLIAVLARVWLQRQTEDDAVELLRLTSNISASIFWRDDIASALVSGWPGSASIKQACLKALDMDSWRGRGHVDREIAEAVVVRGYPQDDEVVDRLITRASKREDRSFLINHQHNLGLQLATNFKRHPILSPFLDQWLIDHPAETSIDVEDCMLAMTTASDTAKAYLLRSLELTQWIQWPAGALMAVWGTDDPSVSAALIDIATGPAEKASSVADLIPQLILDRPEARSTLLRLLRDPASRRIDFILTGLHALGRDDGSDEVVDIVLERLRTGNPLFRDTALPLLISHYATHPVVRLMADEEVCRHGWWTSLAAAAYPNDAEFGPHIFRAASTLPITLRQIIVSDPSIGTNDPSFALQLFGAWNREVDDEVKTETSVSFHRLKVMGTGLDDADVTALREGIVALGPDYEARRQASFAGLIIADRLDLLNLPEAQDEHAKFLIGFTFYRNVALVRTILHHWEFLTQKLGDDFWKILQRFESNRLHLWSTLAPFLLEHEIPRGEALRFLSSRAGRDSTPEILAFLANATTHRALLLEYLLAALAGVANGGREPLLALTAAELLAAEFGGDPDVGKQLEAKFEEKRPYGWIQEEAGWTLIALCIGWPGSSIIHGLIAELRASGSNLPLTLPVWHLMCLESPSEGVFKNFTAILSEIEDASEYWNPPMARALTGRLRRDETLAKMMEERLYSSGNPTEKATIPRIFAAARGVSDSIRSWAVREIDAQISNATGPEMGIDYSVGRMRPVVHTLLEVLAA
jgi:hypothetical protein